MTQKQANGKGSPRWLLLVYSAMLLSMVWIGALPAAAQQPPPGLKMEAAAAFGGHFKYGEWLPVWASIENNGPDMQAEVRVHVASTSGATTFAAPVSLPTGSRKLVPVYVLPNNFARTLEVQLIDSEGEAVVSQRLDVRPAANISFVAGLVAPERGALALISGADGQGTGRAKMLIDLSLSDLPERMEGLRSLDCLVINDVDTSSLTPLQQQALASWVEQGGWLVVGGGAGARRTVSGLPATLLPLRPEREVELDALPGLARLGKDIEVRVPGPFLASVGQEAAGVTLAAQDGVILFQEHRVGDGVVHFSALDLAGTPFDAWAGTVELWGQLISTHAVYPINLPPDVSPRQMISDQMSYALSNLPSLSLPSVQWVAALLGAYVLLVGPVNYLLLRWRRRLQWAWITIPAITLLFSGCAFGLAYALRGTDLIVNKIAVVHLQPGRAAQAKVYVGLFSPARQSYEIEVEGGGLLSSLNPNYSPFSAVEPTALGAVVFVQGSPGRVRGLSVNQWSMQTFMTEDVWPDFGGIESDLTFEDDKLVGSVRNDTTQVLKDAVVLLNNQFVRLGDLAPGQEVEVQLDLLGSGQDLFGPPLSYRLFEQEFQQAEGPPRDVQFKQQILDSVFNSGRYSAFSSMRGGGISDGQDLMLIGWFNRSPPRVRVDDRDPVEVATALLHAPLRYRLPESGELSIPVGLVPGSIVEMPFEGGPCGPEGVPAVYLGRGSATIQFDLPSAAEDVQINELVLALRPDGGWQHVPEVSLYDWTADQWLLVQDPVIGENRIAPATALTSANGTVRVRLTSTGDGGCYYVQMGIKGTR